MKLAAISVLSNKLQVLAKAALPNPPRKVYLEFETPTETSILGMC